MLTLAFIAGFLQVAAPEWAAPANTALLILLTLLSRSNRGKLDDAKEKLEAVHQDVSSAAAAGLAAAEAAAHAATASSDAARVAKELGAVARRTELDPPSH